MDRQLIWDSLKLPDETRLFVVGMHVIYWGRKLTLECITGDPQALSFELQLEDCREIHWQLYTHIVLSETIPFPKTEMVNFRIGKSHHRRPGYFLTEHFGLSLTYDQLILRSSTIETNL